MHACRQFAISVLQTVFSSPFPHSQIKRGDSISPFIPRNNLFEKVLFYTGVGTMFHVYRMCVSLSAIKLTRRFTLHEMCFDSNTEILFQELEQLRLCWEKCQGVLN